MENNQNTMKTPKKKGIIRWEAIIPFVVFCALFAAYFHFFFDSHLRSGMEWAGYKAIGAEVNIAKVETSFFNAHLLIKGIEVTDAEKPTHNSFQIGEIRFGMLWDALLRAKAVINEAVIEQIEFGVKRKYVGKVKPPEPASNDPSLTEKLKAQALAEAQGQAGDNILGDVIAMLGGSTSDEQLEALKAKIPSKGMLESFEKDLKAKKDGWDARLKTLPQGKDLQALTDRLNKIKHKDFKNAQELQQSLGELNQLVNEGNAIYKQVQTTGDDLGRDLKGVETQYKEIEKQIKADINSLEQHFRIPKLDAKAMTMAIFNRYLGPYKLKFFRYKEMAEKYIPPNLLNKDEKSDDVVIQPHPREEGVSYEFGRLNAYPLFWIKRTFISSQAGSTPQAGNIKGELLDVTSNQRVIGRPTVATLAGDFPGMEILGFLAKVSLDNTKALSRVDYRLQVGSYPLKGQELVKTPDVSIAFEKAQGGLTVVGTMIGLKEIQIEMNNEFNKIDYAISSKNEIADSILKAVFAGIPMVNLNVKGQGTFPNIPLSINSNLGPELQKGFQKQIQAKIEEAQQKIKAAVEAEIGKQKSQIEAQLKLLRNQFDGEVKKVQAQAETQKTAIQDRIDQAKKDAENQAKAALEKEKGKAVDELKKRLGL